MLVTPRQWSGHWWFLDDRGENGWLQGHLSIPLLNATARFIALLAKSRGIDSQRVALMGFSAGAYACTELLGSRLLPPIRGVGLGGTHGHGAEDMTDVPERMRRQGFQNFMDYMERVQSHSGAAYIEMSHALEDVRSRYADACRIREALNVGQRAAHQPSVKFRTVPPDRPSKTNHNYYNAAFVRPAFFKVLLGTRVTSRVDSRQDTTT